MTFKKKNNNTRKRLLLIDSLRGLSVLSMIGYHFCWFACFFSLFISDELMYGKAFAIWERSICCTFIFLSGFVFSLGKKKIKNGLMILSIGVALTVISVLFLNDIRDVFGILWILGLFPLVLYLPDKYIWKNMRNEKFKTVICLAVSFLLFIITYNINHGYLGLLGRRWMLPQELYKGNVMTFIGFMEPGFYSVDYFSIFPWIFMYLMGYFAQKLTYGSYLYNNVFTVGIPVLKDLGRHSLIIYLVHPVVIFALLYILKMIL